MYSRNRKMRLFIKLREISDKIELALIEHTDEAPLRIML